MKYWWNALAPVEDIEDLYIELSSRKIPRHAGMNKLRWGYSNLGRFNIKEAIGVMNET